MRVLNTSLPFAYESSSRGPTWLLSESMGDAAGREAIHRGTLCEVLGGDALANRAGPQIAVVVRGEGGSGSQRGLATSRPLQASGQHALLEFLA